MKILLLGEFSGFHRSLRDGLRVLGHDAIVVGSGDGTKAIPVDWHIGSNEPGFRGTLGRMFKAMRFVALMPRADVVQIVNPYVFPRGANFNNWLLQLVRHRSPRFFLSACGDDAYFVQKGIRHLRYSPIPEAVLYDYKAASHPLESLHDLDWNSHVVEMADGIIPVMYDYFVGYKDTPKVKPIIPLPVNTDSIPFRPNERGSKIVVLHGAGRAGFKGSRHILGAFEYLSEKYPDVFEFIYVQNLPLDRYLEVMARANIVVDQANSYSSGMNALIALAMGKIVLGGAEPESNRVYEGDFVPVFNILPSAQNIVNVIEKLMSSEESFSELGWKGRLFVEKHHNYIDIASRYVNTWFADHGKL